MEFRRLRMGDLVMKIDDRKWHFICKQLDELKKQAADHDAAIGVVKLEAHSPLTSHSGAFKMR